MNGENVETGSTEARSPGTVLIVEDDRSLAELYARWLDGPYDVETAYDGETALDRLDGSVDVVLLDRRMHGRSGDEVLSEIRDAAVDCRVVMVSAVTPDIDIVKMGFDAYLQKPVDEGGLRRTVDRMRTRSAYDEKLQELFSLIERQDTLEAVKTAETLDASEEYETLTDRLRMVQAEVESLLTDLSDEDFRVAVERLQRTAAERTDRRRYRSLTDDVLDSSREATVVVDADGTVVWANEATERLLGLDREDLGGRPYESVATEELEPVTTGDPDDGTSLADLVREGLTDRDTELDTVVHVPGDDDLTRPRRVLEYWSGPIETGLYAGGRIEHFHDITDRYTHEQRLQALHRATRELMTAETAEEIADRAVTTASSALGFSCAAVYTREEATGALTLTDRATGDDESLPTPAAVSEHQPVSGGNGPVWSAFSAQSGALRASTYRERHGDLADNAGDPLGDRFEDWLVCPLGRRGALVVAMAERSFSDGERNLAKTWAGNVRQTLERFARDRDLRERDRRLKRQNEQLSVLNRINTLIRSIGPAVVNADSREAVESAVCNRLVELDLVTGVWVADVDIATGELLDRAAAGLDDYLGDVPTGTDSTTEPGPARRAYETGDPVVVEDLLSVDPGSWWRDRGLNRGSHTVFAVPVVNDGRRFGAIEIHVDRPRGVNDEEVDAVAELGTLVGHAIAAIRKRDALLSGGAVTLDFHIEREPTLSSLADAVDVPLSVTDVSQTVDAGCVLFVEADGGGDRDPPPVDPEVVLADRDRDRDGVSIVRERPDAVVYRVSLADDSPIQELVDRGAALNRIGVEGGETGLTVSVTLSHDVDVRDYVDAVTHGDVELVAKRDGPGDRQSLPGTVARLDDSLTDRQREALQVAFHAGYFDWPRGGNGQSVADELGIAQSTFSQHLRAAEAKLLRELYG